MQAAGRRDRHGVAVGLGEHRLHAREPGHAPLLAGALCPRLHHVADGGQRQPIDLRNGVTVVGADASATDQAETDRYWNAIVGNGGQESACGWCKDKWGLSWQITPIALTEAVTDPDPAAAKRAFDAMMEMKKIDIAAIEAARRG